jgi:hypothetical protein
MGVNPKKIRVPDFFDKLLPAHAHLFAGRWPGPMEELLNIVIPDPVHIGPLVKRPTLFNGLIDFNCIPPILRPIKGFGRVATLGQLDRIGLLRFDPRVIRTPDSIRKFRLIHRPRFTRSCVLPIEPVGQAVVADGADVGASKVVLQEIKGGKGLALDQLRNGISLSLATPSINKSNRTKGILIREPETKTGYATKSKENKDSRFLS